MSLDSACKLLVRGERQLRLLLTITRAVTNSVLVMADSSVEASVRESDDHKVDPSDEIASKQETTDENNDLNRWSASIRSTHLVRHKSFSL